jgi:hypothetical protein
MTIACLFEWSQLSRAQYQELLSKLNGSGEFCSVNACYDGKRLIAIGVWENSQALHLFRGTCFSKYLVQVGLPQPAVKTWSLEGKDETSQVQAVHEMDDKVLGKGRDLNRN